MPVSDDEPRYRFVDGNGNVVGSIYFDTANEEFVAAFDDGTEATIAQK